MSGAVRITLLSLVTILLASTLTAAITNDAFAANQKAANLAIVAKPSTSYISGDTKLSALNDGIDPRRSGEWRHGSYGNWPRTGTQWVEYEWSQPISTDRIDTYWWADGQGIHPPKASRLLYWNSEKNEFQPVANAQGLGVERDKFNKTTFDKVMTPKLRLEIDADGTNSTGLLEWRVFDAGDSPKFPPSVVGDVDRVVMVGGKTYLRGTIKSLASGDDPAAKVAWTKESGAGDVAFADAGAIETSATFSQVGDYVLKLTADENGLSDAARVNVKVENPPPAKPLGVVYTKRYIIDNPLWQHRAKALITKWIPHCIEKINDPNVRENTGGIDNFEEAAKKNAGQPAKPHRGYAFSNAWVHQTVEAMCIALMVDPQGDGDIARAQEQLKITLEDWIPKIIAAKSGTVICKRHSRSMEGKSGGRRGSGPIMKVTSLATSSSRRSIITRSPTARIAGCTTRRKSSPIAGWQISVRRRKRNGTTGIRRWSRHWCGSGGS